MRERAGDAQAAPTADLCRVFAEHAAAAAYDRLPAGRRRRGQEERPRRPRRDHGRQRHGAGGPRRHRFREGIWRTTRSLHPRVRWQGSRRHGCACQRRHGALPRLRRPDALGTAFGKLHPARGVCVRGAQGARVRTGDDHRCRGRAGHLQSHAPARALEEGLELLDRDGRAGGDRRVRRRAGPLPRSDRPRLQHREHAVLRNDERDPFRRRRPARHVRRVSRQGRRARGAACAERRHRGSGYLRGRARHPRRVLRQRIRSRRHRERPRHHVHAEVARCTSAGRPSEPLTATSMRRSRSSRRTNSPSTTSKRSACSSATITSSCAIPCRARRAPAHARRREVQPALHRGRGGSASRCAPRRFHRRGSPRPQDSRRGGDGGAGRRPQRSTGS